MSDKPKSGEELTKRLAGRLSDKYADELIAGAEVKGKVIAPMGKKGTSHGHNNP